MKRKGKKDQREWEATLQLAKQSFAGLSKKICQILVAPVLPRHVGQTNTLLLQEKQEKKYIKTLSNKNKLLWVCPWILILHAPLLITGQGSKHLNPLGKYTHLM